MVWYSMGVRQSGGGEMELKVNANLERDHVKDKCQAYE